MLYKYLINCIKVTHRIEYYFVLIFDVFYLLHIYLNI